MESESVNAAEVSADQLLVKVRCGFEALGELLKMHERYLLSLAHAEMGSDIVPRQGRSDVVSRVFLNILEQLDRSTSGLFTVSTTEEFKKWIRRILLNEIKKVHRDEGAEGRNYQRTVELDGASAMGESSIPTPSSLAEKNELIEILGDVIADLPEADRLLLRLRIWYDWPYKQLSELLNGDSSDAGRRAIGRRLDDLYLNLGEDESVRKLD